MNGQLIPVVSFDHEDLEKIGRPIGPEVEDSRGCPFRIDVGSVEVVVDGVPDVVVPDAVSSGRWMNFHRMELSYYENPDEVMARRERRKFAALPTTPGLGSGKDLAEVVAGVIEQSVKPIRMIQRGNRLVEGDHPPVHR